MKILVIDGQGGGIGSGINMKHAVTIGMFPDIPLERFHYIGNSSLSGAYAMLISTLNRQRDEYRQLQNAAEEMLRARGMQPQGISPAARLSSGAMTALKTLTDHSPANIAEMMIQGSTMGVTKSMRTMGTCSEADPAVLELAQRLLRTEQANIEQMKGFLS